MMSLVSSGSEALDCGHWARIPVEELTFTHARSSGPGGQNVNKVNTAVVLRFNVEESPSLTDSQKRMVNARLANRINAAGELVLQADTARTQADNKRLVMERFASLMANALAVAKVRRPTKPGKAAKARRVDAKKRRAQTKVLRSKLNRNNDW